MRRPRSIQFEATAEIRNDRKIKQKRGGLCSALPFLISRFLKKAYRVIPIPTSGFLPVRATVCAPYEAATSRVSASALLEK